MRKVLLITLLLYVKTISAQSVSLGGNILGATYYQFRQASFYDRIDLPFEIFAQYTFKDSSFGVECTTIYNIDGVPQPQRFYSSPDGQSKVSNPSSYFNLMPVVYFVYNPFPKQKNILLQLKAGMFYAPFYMDYSNHFTDYGPAVSLYLATRIYKQCYLGLDVSEMTGTKNFNFPSYTADNYSANGIYEGQYVVPALLSQVSYLYIQVKLFYRL